MGKVYLHSIRKLLVLNGLMVIYSLVVLFSITMVIFTMGHLSNLKSMVMATCIFLMILSSLGSLLMEMHLDMESIFKKESLFIKDYGNRVN